MFGVNLNSGLQSAGCDETETGSLFKGVRAWAVQGIWGHYCLQDILGLSSCSIWTMCSDFPTNLIGNCTPEHQYHFSMVSKIMAAPKAHPKEGNATDTSLAKKSIRWKNEEIHGTHSNNMLLWLNSRKLAQVGLTQSQSQNSFTGKNKVPGNVSPWSIKYYIQILKNTMGFLFGLEVPEMKSQQLIWERLFPSLLGNLFPFSCLPHWTKHHPACCQCQTVSGIAHHWRTLCLFSLSCLTSLPFIQQSIGKSTQHFKVLP